MLKTTKKNLKIYRIIKNTNHMNSEKEIYNKLLPITGFVTKFYTIIKNHLTMGMVNFGNV